jgi:hypothetical protein
VFLGGEITVVDENDPRGQPIVTIELDGIVIRMLTMLTV